MTEPERFVEVQGRVCRMTFGKADREPTDAERLDWLAANGMECHRHYRSDQWHVTDMDGLPVARGTTLRAAIDAAMRRRKGDAPS